MTTYQCRQLSDALHHAPQDRADDDVGEQQAGGAGVGVGGAGSDEQAGANAGAEADHGDLVVAEAALGAAVAADVELGLEDGGLVVMMVVGAGLFDVADGVVFGGGPDGLGAPVGLVRGHGWRTRRVTCSNWSKSPGLNATCEGTTRRDSQGARIGI